MNYLQIGGLYEFNYDRQFRPFINGSLGIGIFDPKTEGIGSETRFSWSVGTGAKYMFNSGRIGLRGDLRLWITPVPSGDYGTWCDFYGCFVVEGTAWVGGAPPRRAGGAPVGRRGSPGPAALSRRVVRRAQRRVGVAPSATIVVHRSGGSDPTRGAPDG